MDDEKNLSSGLKEGARQSTLKIQQLEKNLATSQKETEQLQNELKEKCARYDLPLGCTIPIGLHGDAVPFQVSKSVEVFSWNCS